MQTLDNKKKQIGEETLIKWKKQYCKPTQIVSQGFANISLCQSPPSALADCATVLSHDKTNFKFPICLVISFLPLGLKVNSVQMMTECNLKRLVAGTRRVNCKDGLSEYLPFIQSNLCAVMSQLSYRKGWFRKHVFVGLLYKDEMFGMLSRLRKRKRVGDFTAVSIKYM